MISNRFESLAQAFRVFGEQHIRFPGLFLIDPPEAVGNLDHAIDGILNAFHGLYDAVKIEASGAFDFYRDPICALVLRLRNARHHNQANGIRSIYRCARTEEHRVDYLLINFAAGESERGGGFAEHYISWADVCLALASQSEKYAASVGAGRASIHAKSFEDWCLANGYLESQMFVNLIPILSAAGTACVRPLTEYINPQSVEAEAFLDIFTTVRPANFAKQDFIELTNKVFWPT